MYKIKPCAYQYDSAITNNLDVHIGQTIKKLREEQGLTKRELSLRTGVSLPQIQKYEDSTNRVSSSRLYWFARALNTSPNHFFDSFVTKPLSASGLSDNEQEPFVFDDPLLEEETLLSAYFSIKDPEKRQEILENIKAQISG
ncbi:MAG: helix-turn-helix domain-containing protein [Bdellovibrionales bacterium]